MSKKQYSRSVDQELKHINEIIDFKILHGVGYYGEARRHRQLLIQSARINKKKGRGIWNTLLSFMF
jgi:hypothetical protein